MRATVMRDWELRVDDVPDPVPGPGQVLTKVLACGICGSDLHLLQHGKEQRELAAELDDGQPDPLRPVIIPERDDRLYRSWTTKTEPETNAAILYMMDVSGSMTDEQKEIVRVEAFWIDTWLKSQYDGVDVRYIIHDAVAREVDEDTFYHTRESGGTRISSAYKVARELIRL